MLFKILQRFQIISVHNQWVSANYSVFNTPNIQDKNNTETMNEQCKLLAYKSSNAIEDGFAKEICQALRAIFYTP